MSREKSVTPVQTFVLRIFTFGSLEIVWEGTSLPFPPERMSGRGAAPALSLLKLLLCQPGRFASRDVIMEQFWPDSPRATAEERLHDVATSLRRLLRPPEDHSKILYYIPAGPENASGYRLEAHPYLWVDADAFRWNLEQALRMERYGQPSLALWDRAYQLASRGVFLQEEVYTSWPLSRRRLLDGQYRQCVHRLAHLLREAGMLEEAMMRLHSYWQTSPTDEDALRSLMEMLGEQERFGEAEQYYQQALEALKQDEKEPDRHTLDVRECLQAQQIMRRQKRASVVQPAAKQEIVVSPSSNNQPDMTSIPLSQAIKEGIIGAVCELRELSPMKRSNLLDRRTCIEWLISIFPLLLAKDELFTPTQEESRTSFTSLASLREQAPYTLFEDVLAMGWESTYRGGSKHLAERIDQHLSLLTAQANQASTTEMGSWLSLLCRYYQLASRLAQRHLKPELAVLYAQQALNLAISLENTELKALGFFWRARLHLEQQQPELARRDTTAALDLAERVRGPLQGNIYLLAAEVFAPSTGNDRVLYDQCRIWQSKAITLADQDILEDDTTFVKLNKATVYHESAKIFLQLYHAGGSQDGGHFQEPRSGLLKEAENALAIAQETLTPDLVIWQINFLITEAKLSGAANNLERSAQAGIQALTLTRPLQAHDKEAQIQKLYQQLVVRDALHPHIRNLGLALSLA